MLANGATLGMKASGASSYTNLPGLKEIPDMGVDPEKVENTCLTDSIKQYENGIGDAGDMEYKFKYDNSKAGTAYRLLKAQENNVVSFKEELADGTTTTFDAQVSIKRNGGGVNGVIEFTLALSLQSGLTIVDPA